MKTDCNCNLCGNVTAPDNLQYVPWYKGQMCGDCRNFFGIDRIEQECGGGDECEASAAN